MSRKKALPLFFALFVLFGAFLSEALAHRRGRASVVVTGGYRAGVVVAPRHHHHVSVYRGPRVVRVERVDYGSVDFNIRPQNSKIYVDGRYLGIADQFNGYPQTAKLPAGYHTIRVVTPDGRSESRRIYVAAGRELNFNLKF